MYASATDPAAVTASAGRAALAVRGLCVELATDDGLLPAVTEIDFELAAGETLALVGESGAGKSLTALALMRLLPRFAAGRGARTRGSALLATDGEGTVDLLAVPSAQMRALRGRSIAMVFQEPMTCLNPVLRVGDQIVEAVRAHETLTRRAAQARAVRMLQEVGIPEPAHCALAFPHQLSGGMRQRVMIAMALVCGPCVLIADEPTTALDVTVQAQVLDLIRRLQRERGTAVLFITHDLGVVAQMADRVAVLYSGRVVEAASVDALFDRPRHPYTRGLLASMPDPFAVAAAARAPIPGAVANLAALPRGCAFHPRCARHLPGHCDAGMPPLEPVGEGHRVRCARWRDASDAQEAA